jgi:hypothetical protein
MPNVSSYESLFSLVRRLSKPLTPHVPIPLKCEHTYPLSSLVAFAQKNNKPVFDREFGRVVC